MSKEKYTIEQAIEESGKLKEIISSGQAKNYREAENKLTADEAEEAVAKIFSLFPGAKVRKATIVEDSGLKQIGHDLAIDRIVYLDENPSAALQITIATDSSVRLKKKEDLAYRPFIRLPEMKLSDTPIPRVLIYIDAQEIEDLRKDINLENHPNLIKKVLTSAVNSLRFDMLKTKNPREQELVNQLLALISQKQSEIEKTERTRSIN